MLIDQGNRLYKIFTAIKIDNAVGFLKSNVIFINLTSRSLNNQKIDLMKHL